MIFHVHRWLENSRYFIPPVDREMTVRGRDTLRRALYGFTVVELQCDCGDVTYRELPGDATDQGRAS